MIHNYYYLDEAGEVAGPVDVTIMRLMLSNKVLNAKSRVCLQGTDTWQALSKYPELALSTEEMVALRHQVDAKEAMVPGIVGWFRLIGWVVVALGVLGMVLSLVTMMLPAVLGFALVTIPLAALMFGAGWLLTWTHETRCAALRIARHLEQD